MSVKDNGDVYFVPAFSGLFSPHWDETARGVLVGLTRFSNKSHIARAVLESVAYQSFELIESMERDTGTVFESVSVDGGMVENNLLMQFQSDIFDKKVISQEINEITALGAGAASFLYLNEMPFENMGNFITKSTTWNPNMNSEVRSKYVAKWNKAISKAKQWI
jgi:glycerol kinase